MEKISIRQLSPFDGEDVYDMLQHIGENENEFKNPVKGMSYDEYKQWLKQQDDWSRSENLPDGYVGQTCFWLIVDHDPVGFGKIRHALTNSSRQIGGNIGCAISSEFRGNGYGVILMKELIQKAKEMGVDEILVTVEKNNIASKIMNEKAGGCLFKENEFRWFFSF